MRKVCLILTIWFAILTIIGTLSPACDCGHSTNGSGCKPNADAGNDRTLYASPGTPITVVLNGTGSHPDPECPQTSLVEYNWTVEDEPSGSDVTIIDADSALASVEFLRNGSYKIRLEVKDSRGGTDSDDLQLTLEEVECGPPIVDAGQDLQGSVGRPVLVKGSLRLPPEENVRCQDDKISVAFQWEQQSGPDAFLSSSDQLETSFTPTETGEYSFRLRATYPITGYNPVVQESQWDSVNVTVSEAVCLSPTASAGPDQILGTVNGIPRTVILDGSQSCPDSRLCSGVSLIRYTWTVASAPPGVTLDFTSDLALATVSLGEFGEYEFQLEVQDDAGTDGRADTDTDTVKVTLSEITDTDGTLQVTVVDAATWLPVTGAHVYVIDSEGTSHTADSNADGITALSGLANGPIESITAASDDTVPGLPGTMDGERLRYEITTVLDHASNRITIPLRLTSSGQAAIPTGTLVAKMPQNVFDLLPHSWKCVGACTIDHDCDETYYCEDRHPCQDLCTPRSLLPFFGLGDPNTSGQFRFVMLVPVLSGRNLDYGDIGRIFAPPPNEEAIFPSNMATDDTFVNGLAPTFGINPWGVPCVSRDDCPNSTDYSCDEDPNGDYRCRDRNPMRNIKIDVPAGTKMRLALVAGIIDVNMVELLPYLLPFMTGHEVNFQFFGGVLSTFDMTALHICPISIDAVLPGETIEISDVLSRISEEACWNVDYRQQERTVPILHPGAIQGGNRCGSHADCGWPQSGQMCLDAGDGQSYCLIPMFRVEILTGDHVEVAPDFTQFDPAEVDADGRLCESLPPTAPYEVLCEDPDTGVIGPCNPPVVEDLAVPPDAECSIPYGVTLAALDLPRGHTSLPDGGLVFIGFDFNHKRSHFGQNASFLVPGEVLTGGAAFGANQLFYRNIMMSRGTYWPVPGWISAAGRWESVTCPLCLPPLFSLPLLEPPPVDTGLSVKVTFIAEDPTLRPSSPNFELERTCTEAIGVNLLGMDSLPGTLVESTLPGEILKGIVIAKVDYAPEITCLDNWWRIYARPGTTEFVLPAGVSPFSVGDDVWVTPWGCEFKGPFDYDLFPVEVLLGARAVYSEDSFAAMVTSR